MAGSQSAPVAGRTVCVLAWSATQTQVREATGRNDGREVAAYLKVVGLPTGYEWCGAYQAYGNKHCGAPFPAAAGRAANWTPASSQRTYYVRGVRGSVDSLKRLVGVLEGKQVGKGKRRASELDVEANEQVVQAALGRQAAEQTVYLMRAGPCRAQVELVVQLVEDGFHDLPPPG